VGRRTDTPKIKTELRLTQTQLEFISGLEQLGIYGDNTVKLLKGGAAAEIGGLMPTIKPQSMLQ
jgi:hypothetical protein